MRQNHLRVTCRRSSRAALAAWRGESVIRVLLADDDADVRAALAALLASDPNIDVIAACADGSEALDSAALDNPDVAVLDVRMPAGGAGLVREFADRGVRVVCFSADVGSSAQMIDAGALAFLVKGAQSLDLLNTVRSLGATS